MSEWPSQKEEMKLLAYSGESFLKRLPLKPKLVFGKFTLVLMKALWSLNDPKSAFEPFMAYAFLNKPSLPAASQ